MDSSSEMILLGFKFGNKPTVAAHVDFIISKFNSRSWLIRHLKQAGVPDQDLVKIFATVIRPVIEYAVPVYHPLLTEDQKSLIESLQRRILKIIYGYKTSYARALESSGLPSLEDRRREIVEKFVLKIKMNPNFGHWIPTHRPYVYNMRNVQRYQEETAHTERLYKSPIFTFRRLLNNEL